MTDPEYQMTEDPPRVVLWSRTDPGASTTGPRLVRDRSGAGHFIVLEVPTGRGTRLRFRLTADDCDALARALLAQLPEPAGSPSRDPDLHWAKRVLVLAPNFRVARATAYDLGFFDRMRYIQSLPHLVGYGPEETAVVLVDGWRDSWEGAGDMAHIVRTLAIMEGSVFDVVWRGQPQPQLAPAVRFRR